MSEIKLPTDELERHVLDTVLHRYHVLIVQECGDSYVTTGPPSEGRVPVVQTTDTTGMSCEHAAGFLFVQKVAAARSITVVGVI